MIKHYYYIQEDNYSYIYDLTIDEFLTHNPPCKGCLVQPTCIIMHISQLLGYSPKLVVKVCKELSEFMKGKKCFTIINK